MGLSSLIIGFHGNEPSGRRLSTTFVFGLGEHAPDGGQQGRKHARKGLGHEVADEPGDTVQEVLGISLELLFGSTELRLALVALHASGLILAVLLRIDAVTFGGTFADDLGTISLDALDIATSGLFPQRLQRRGKLAQPSHDSFELRSTRGIAFDVGQSLAVNLLTTQVRSQLTELLDPAADSRRSSRETTLDGTPGGSRPTTNGLLDGLADAFESLGGSRRVGSHIAGEVFQRNAIRDRARQVLTVVSEADQRLGVTELLDREVEVVQIIDRAAQVLECNEIVIGGSNVNHGAEEQVVVGLGVQLIGRVQLFKCGKHVVSPIGTNVFVV